jgi:tetratricopeptide (TPR) repeat protein
MDESLKIIFDTASNHFINGDYKKAEPILHQLVLKNYKNAKLFYMLGAIQYQKNDIKKALRSFKRSLEIDPAFTDAGIGLSVIFNDLGQYEEGQKVFMATQKQLKSPHQIKETSSKSKLFMSKHLELARLYNEDKNYSEALQQLVKAKSLSFETSKIQILIAECLLNLKQYQKAINELKDIVSKEQNNIPALMRLGQVYSLTGQKESAINIFEKILLIDRNHLGASQRLSILKSQRNTYTKEL